MEPSSEFFGCNCICMSHFTSYTVSDAEVPKSYFRKSSSKEIVPHFTISVGYGRYEHQCESRGSVVHTRTHTQIYIYIYIYSMDLMRQLNHDIAGGKNFTFFPTWMIWLLRPKTRAVLYSSNTGIIGFESRTGREFVFVSPLVSRGHLMSRSLVQDVLQMFAEPGILEAMDLVSPKCHTGQKFKGNMVTACLVTQQMWYRRAKKLKLNSVSWVRERTIPTERPPFVGEVSANFCA
jgi:hypothetical protein